MPQQSSVAHERVGMPFDGLELSIVVERAHDDGVDQQQEAAADQTARERIVIADDRVLHGIREQQQNDEVEGVQLGELAFAGQAQANQEKGIDREGSQELLGDRNARQ